MGRQFFRRFNDTCLGILCVWFFAHSSAVGADDPTTKRSQPDTPRGSGKTEKIEFSGLKLNGQLKKPDLSYIYKRGGLRSEQIVNIPEDFNEEIIQGAGRF